MAKEKVLTIRNLCLFFLFCMMLDALEPVEGEWVFDGGWCWCNPSRQSCSLQHTGCERHCVSNPWGVGCHPEPGNLASSKPAVQSGTMGSNYASLAVDGNNSTSLSGCATTAWMTKPWWWVDLKGLYVVHRVYILNTDHTEKCIRLKDFDIRIGNKSSLTQNALCKHHGEPSVACSAWIELTCNSPVLGRYVGVQLTGDDDSQITICELIVKGYEYPYNVAYSKPASQVDTLDSYTADRAVDGVTGEDYPSDPVHAKPGYPGTCVHTDIDNKPWWEVDLLQMYLVYSVRLVNRLHVPDEGKRRLTKFYIRVGDNSNPSSNPVCIYHGTEIFDSEEFTCSPGPMAGRYVSVQLDSSIPGDHWGASKLTLCEVMVKGYKTSGKPFLNVAPTKDTRTDTSVTIRWTPWTSGSGQGQGSVQSYTVQYRQSGQSSWTGRTGIGSDTTYKEVTGLQKDTSYEFRVLIVNGDGSQIGDPSPTVGIKTCGDPISPTVMPLEQRFALTETFISVKTKVDVTAEWESASEDVHKCESPVRYRVKYKKAGDDGYTERGVFTGTWQTVLGGLIPYTNYIVAVSIINSANLEGPAGLKTFQTMEGVPPKMGKPVITNPTLSSLTLNWQRPDPPHGVIVGYQYQYWKDGDSHHTVQSVASNNQQSQMKVLDNLENNVLYKIKIRAKTSVDYGEWSEEARAITVGAPSKPGNVVVTATTSSSLTVSWTKPNETHGELVRYEIQYGITLPKINVTEKLNGEIKTSAYITGLKAATEYSILIRGVNTLSFGEWSDSVKVKTEDGYPEKPRSLSSSSISTLNATVSWQPPAITNGNLVKYEVQYWPTGDISSDQIMVVSKAENHGLETMTAIENLKPYTIYTIQVRAYTSAGAGDWSDTLEIKTLEWVPSAPRQLSLQEKTKTIIVLEWQKPDEKNGKILQYLTECSQLSTTFNQTTTALSATFTGLTPGTKYNCHVAAATVVGYGEWSQNFEVYTESDVKPPAPVRENITIGEETIKFTLPNKQDLAPQEATDMSVKIIVEKQKQIQRRRRGVADVSDDILASATHYNASVDQEFYITALLEEHDLGTEFTIGDGKTYGGYYNAPLHKDKYSVYFGTEAMLNNGRLTMMFRILIAFQAFTSAFVLVHSTAALYGQRATNLQHTRDASSRYSKRRPYRGYEQFPRGIKCPQGKEEERIYTIATGPNFPPLDVLDPITKKSIGLGIEYGKDICRIARKKCEFVTIPYKECITSDSQGNHIPGESLFKGVVDACISWGITEERKNFYDFTRPFSTAGSNFFAKKDSDFINNLTSLKGLVVGFIVGFASSPHCLDQYRISRDYEIKLVDTYREGVDCVLTGECDLFFVIFAGDVEVLGELALVLEPVADVPFPFVFQCVEGLSVVSRKGDDVTEWWNKAQQTYNETGEMREWCQQLIDEFEVSGSANLFDDQLMEETPCTVEQVCFLKGEGLFSDNGRSICGLPLPACPTLGDGCGA